MTKVYVVGGEQHPDAAAREQGQQYKKGLIVSLDLDSGSAEVCHEYVSPPAVKANEASSTLFKAATLDDGRLYCCTPTEVFVYELPSFRQLHYISLSGFNDIHHVRPHGDDALLVVNTGLDMVMKVALDGAVLREWSVLSGVDVWSRFSRAIDYRKVPSTKPHRAHPNYVFELNGGLWATRFEQGDVVCLDDLARTIDLGRARPHDGISVGDRLWLTSVDGHLIAVDRNRLRVVEAIDLNSGRSDIRKLGWCRGIHFLSPRLALVGFSRIRPTRWHNNLSWVKGGVTTLKLLAQQPAHLGLFDLARRLFVAEYPLQEVGLSAIFSIHPS